jgi:hypothetical protein
LPGGGMVESMRLTWSIGIGLVSSFVIDGLLAIVRSYQSSMRLLATCTGTFAS